ncbi:MAG TPA: hypothetical protein VFV00_04925 [Acidimicrobiales bacterium]|nr:hypothetical protein [Acidimicrobiales bacterium]
METEFIIADTVRRWAHEVLPEEPAAGEAAAALAIRCYMGGASVAEACQEARHFVESWSRHPSHRTSMRTPMSIAS